MAPARMQFDMSLKPAGARGAPRGDDAPLRLLLLADLGGDRAVPLRAKQLATVMMAISSLGTWWVIPSPWRWAPGVCCLMVALWLWSLPTAAPRPREVGKS